MIDKQFFRNIVINLLSNAIKFSPQNSNIDVDTKVTDDQSSNEADNSHIVVHTKVTSKHLELVVKDCGIGIPEEEKGSLFERFFRAKNASNIQGTGLGLSIVAKYIEVLHGTIKFESELNKGTIFNIIIPVQNENNSINWR